HRPRGQVDRAQAAGGLRGAEGSRPPHAGARAHGDPHGRDRRDRSHRRRMTAAPGETIVRPVAAADFAHWLPLWDGYHAFYGRTGPAALPAEITWTTWSRFFDAAEPVHALVAQAADRLVGLAHYLFHRSTIRIEPVCYLQDLY